jgi:hypothetical protein
MSTRVEQARYESLLTSSAEAIDFFRKHYRQFHSIPGVQRSISDGELMAACAFRTYQQCVFHILVIGEL